MTISRELLDELLKGCERPEDLLGGAGLMKELKIRLMERMLGAELTAHLGYEEGKGAPPDQPNRRNGSSAKVPRAKMVRCQSPCRVTGMAASSPNWSRKARRVSTASTARLWASMVDTPFFDEAKPDKLQPEDVAVAEMFALNQDPRAEVREVHIMPTN